MYYVYYILTPYLTLIRQFSGVKFVIIYEEHVLLILKITKNQNYKKEIIKIIKRK